MTDMKTQARPLPVELPRSARAHQGSAAMTAWCPRCRERAVPMRNGTCGFCDTRLTARPTNDTLTDPPPMRSCR